MNNLKYGVLLCGLAGLAACFIPDSGASFFDGKDTAVQWGYGRYARAIGVNAASRYGEAQGAARRTRL